MRVLVTIFEQLVPLSGGGTPRIRSIIDRLVRNGHKVSVAASFRSDPSEAVKILNCARVVPLKNISRFDKKKMQKYLFYHPLNISKVVREAMSFKPDLIIVHNSIAGLAAILAKKIVNCLIVVDMTDLIFEYLSSYTNVSWTSYLQKIGEKLENKVIRDSDKIITISNTMKKILKGRGAEDSRVNVVYDGVKTDVFTPRRKEAMNLRQKYGKGVENIIIFHGVIDPQDNPEIIVDTAARVVKDYPSTMFWIVGDGTALPSIKKETQKQGLEKHFFFSGWVPFEQVPSFISASDLGLVILPDIQSARIRVTLKGFEYWACEKPIIVSDLPALREIVEPWKTGLFYKPGDPMDLAEKISIILNDKNLRKKMGEAGRELVNRKYSWIELAAHFVTICERMVQSTPSATK